MSEDVRVSVATGRASVLSMIRYSRFAHFDFVFTDLCISSESSEYRECRIAPVPSPLDERTLNNDEMLPSARSDSLSNTGVTNIK